MRFAEGAETSQPKRQMEDRPGIEQRLLRLTDRLGILLGQRSGRAIAGPAHLLTGLRGEEEALFHLRRSGYIVVARRWQTPRLAGDVDLIAWDGATLCFIEVKTQTGRHLIPAEFAVDQHKQEILRSLARVFRKRFPEHVRQQIPVRFDVIAVYLPAPDERRGSAVEIEVFQGAFSLHRG